MKKILILESLRGLAATYVFLTHLVLLNFPQQPAWTLPFRFGQEAVMLFFLLSGFVILYSVETAPQRGFGDYILRRFLRIYPIFLLALLLGAVTVGFGAVDLGTLLGNLAMLQDLSDVKPGVLFPPFGDNPPLWSLSYEWWFYLFFYPLYRYLPERLQLPLVTLAALVAVALYNLMPFQPLLFVAYFPLWWAGAEMGRAYARQQAFPSRILLSLALLAAAFALPVALSWPGLANLGRHPILELRHAVACGLFALVCRFLWRRDIALPRRLLAPFALLAPISYGLYLLHFPLVVSPLLAPLPLAQRLPCILAAVLALAWFAEGPYQRFVTRRIKAWVRPAGAIPRT